ncbi:MAG: bifunctional 5,10-methylenetetrahydrofolate dehydrogenase/5,10-methenyltetrahydrofolate cyclohydrolase [Lachnospiraceae bacterium]|nr:bifunctional 5,10-methylenetetrahydrofolate dehydrogenase/5,10-methenyltetrahydrofolate cyclohydrolase [Lachnospiraceae bacterium]
MAIVVKGADVALRIKDNIRERLSILAQKGKTPKLVMIAVGDDPANASYERGIVKVFTDLGIANEKVVLDEGISQEGFDEAFLKVNNDPSVSGILVFRPLPKPLSTEFAARNIDPHKDIDCMGYYNQACLAMGRKDCFYPCTAEAVIRFLDHEGIDTAYKNVVVIGRSVVVGRPLVSMLISRNATVTCCHTKTADLTDRISNADIVVTAAGSAGLLKGEMLKNAKPDCFCIDVGINMRADGKGICGDIDFESVEPLAGKITTVPGGVGSVTSTLLAEHVVRGAEYGLDI